MKRNIVKHNNTVNVIDPYTVTMAFLTQMNVRQLKDFAKRHGFTRYATLKKTELLSLIFDNQVQCVQPQVNASPDETEALYTLRYLQKATVKDLKAICKKHQLKGYSTLKKSQLVDLVLTIAA